jgi:UDP-3-O-[3-hydroxymyristoyl] glucosamine N-acyltransferase
VTDNPRLAFARLVTLLYPEPEHTPGVHPTAVIAAGVRVPASATVGPLAVIEEGVELGERSWVGPGCILQRGARVGEETRLVARVSLYPGVELGARCLVHAGAVIGADGFGLAADGGSWVKISQVGSVRIGNDVEIGANTTVDRGAIGDTVIGEGAKLDNQIQVGHNVIIGAHTAIAACTGISGSTTIGKRCMVGGMVGFAGHLTIADDVVITGCSLVSASIREPGSYSSGMPTVPTRAWRRMVAHLRRFGEKEQ